MKLAYYTINSQKLETELGTDNGTIYSDNNNVKLFVGQNVSGKFDLILNQIVIINNNNNNKEFLIIWS